MLSRVSKSPGLLVCLEEIKGIDWTAAAAARFVAP